MKLFERGWMTRRGVCLHFNKFTFCLHATSCGRSRNDSELLTKLLWSLHPLCGKNTESTSVKSMEQTAVCSKLVLLVGKLQLQINDPAIWLINATYIMSLKTWLKTTKDIGTGIKNQNHSQVLFFHLISVLCLLSGNAVTSQRKVPTHAVRWSIQISFPGGENKGGLFNYYPRSPL